MIGKATSLRVFASLLVSIFMGQSAMADDAKEIDLTVRRNGTKIGFEHISINHEGADTKVAIKVALQVKLLGVTVYRLDQTSYETWRDAQLASIVSVTNEGTEHYLSLARQNESLVGEYDGQPLTIPAAVPPATLWNVSIARSPKLFKNTDGSIVDVTVRDLDQASQAHHLRLSGGFEEEMWFDQDGLLCKFKMEGVDGSDVVFAVE